MFSHALLSWAIAVGFAGAPERGLDELQFNQVLDAVEATYTPILAQRNLRFIIERRWPDDAVNSSPFRGATFVGISISGGIARARGMTQDALALVACHELGHLLGGFPQGNPGMSNEGQADYFATAKCLRRIFTSPSSQTFSRLPASDPVARKACAAAFSGEHQRAICIRSALAALSASRMTSTWRDDEPLAALDTPDPFRTTVTDDRHMPRQCRLDTQFQGALCAKPATEDFSDLAPEPGACTRAEHFTIGMRPRCWYQPPASEPDP
ncbi:MAG: hypothetical protein JST54_02275 [Deltaproteobacteria bacterium]|nr:hypothetical protein [Deltaproteobacteria bacterium]